jgi:DNA-binding NtrC family response regulator/predicted hydrocarbon binding protein
MGLFQNERVPSMRAEDLRLEDLVSFSEGLVSLHGRRLILHDIHAMAQLRKDLVETVGPERSRRIFTRFGYYWGEADAAAMQRVVAWRNVAEWMRAGPQLHRLQGVANVEIRTFNLRDYGEFHFEVEWRESAEAEEQLIELGPSPDGGCWIMLGYASGYASYVLGAPVYFKETSCRGRGDKRCIAVGRDRKSWGDDAEVLSRDYHADDIKGKIDELSTELRKKTLELARQRKRLKRVGPLGDPNTAETRSKSFQQVLDAARRVARFDSSVLITGESGVGKEIVARFVHDNSPRSRKQFVAINCGALPETLLESELFGHKAGSFTGAVRDRAGLFEQAAGGTILLDEIGDVTPALQVTLLRVLQEKKIRRVGDNQFRDIDVRVIAATNRTLDKEVREGRFRDDLFYRLRVVEIHIPPLRERVVDILPLARFFVERLSKRLRLRRLAVEPECLRFLESYPWPGNVRELENALERAAVMSDDGWIRVEHLPPDMVDANVFGSGTASSLTKTLGETERDYVLAVLKSVDGNKTRAAKILGIGNTTLWRKLKEWGEQD